MEHLLTDLADPAKRRQLRDAIEFFEARGMIAAPRAGLRPAGPHLQWAVGWPQRGRSLFHDGRQGIWIGNSKDAGRDVRNGDWFTYTARSDRKANSIRRPAAPGEYHERVA